MVRPLRIGIVGFGRLVREYYVPALSRLRGISTIAVADPLVESRAAAQARLPAATTHAGHETVLDMEPDALLVASPPASHLQIWNDASRAGVPVFMEKPFVLAADMPRARGTPEARRLLMLDFNRRFWPTYRHLRERLREGGLGRIESVELTLHVDLSAWCRVTTHRLDPGEGGLLYDLGSQMLDLAGWLLPDRPMTISAQAWTRRWPDDHMWLRLRDGSGTNVTCDIRYGNRTREGIVVRGTSGGLRLDDPNMALHEAGGEVGARPLDRGRDLLLLGYRGVRRSRSMARHSIAAALAAFFDAVRAGACFQPDFRAAARNVAWLGAASRALASGETVELPQNGDGSVTGD